MGGRRVQVRRPRARTLDGKEVQLPSWTKFAEDPLDERAVEQMLVGVTTRRYERSLEPLPADLPSRGTSKSAVSRRFVAATERQMAEWLGRDLSALDLGVLMIDGVYIVERVLLVALGIDASGEKHVLGVREGATENAASCAAMLADLCERGLHTGRPILVVVDGSKALPKAARMIRSTRARPARFTRGEFADLATQGVPCRVAKPSGRAYRELLARLPTKFHGKFSGTSRAPTTRSRPCTSKRCRNFGALREAFADDECDRHPARGRRVANPEIHFLRRA